MPWSDEPDERPAGLAAGLLEISRFIILALLPAALLWAIVRLVQRYV